MTNSNTPALRFDGFEGVWTHTRLADIAQMYQPQTIGSKELQQSGVPVFGANGFIGFYNAANHTTDQVTISARGEKTGTPSYVSGPVWITGNSMVVNVDSSGIDKRFLYGNLSSRSLKSLITGGAQPQLTRNVLNEYRISIPPTLEEQRAIGELFADLDALIEQHRAKHANLQQTKTALMQRMFPQDGADEPELRLGGFSGAWEVKEFGSVATRSSTASAEPGLPRLEYEDIVSGVGGLNKDLNRKESLKAGLLFGPGDVLYGKLRPYLKNWLLPNFHGIAVGDFWVLQSSTADPKFVYQLIQTPTYDAVANISSGSKMPRADWKLVSQARIAFPPTLEEQRAIGELFADLDALIASEHRYITQLTQAKTALLQRMFV